MSARFGMAFLSVVVVLATAGCAAVPVDHEPALRQLDQSYASAWLSGDADAVMDLFTTDAVLVPHHGDLPVEGKTAIRQGWFDPSYPPTQILQFDRHTADVFWSGEVGIVRGRSVLSWSYQGQTTTIPEGNYVLVAERVETEWKIKLLTWNDDPREWVVQPPRGAN